MKKAYENDRNADENEQFNFSKGSNNEDSEGIDNKDSKGSYNSWVPYKHHLFNLQISIYEDL